ncbi:hypothetical protein [Deinococcus cellulosilyticus]|uniref:Uncharacterized protein n=1 Tax=Deinococcus cellulosilyticus (strain DSM 18568 / NBRC 106333 / KACC 11606 / 5516J-15) TaxID=1223518 RepID=A0A511N7G4_DEIC1|nr:hypothetical protein [Deinococcus cellulosilyticus]GEM48780.1 hypothetical protein DC3_44150 [Deinococcus cellulosilyticus NBRC 106333 = KACC 11606]
MSTSGTGKLRRRYYITTLTLVVMLSFSPSVTWWVSRYFENLKQEALDQTPARVSGLPEAPAGRPRPDVLQAHVVDLQLFEANLNQLQITGERKIKLLESHWQLFLVARRTLGKAKTSALVKLLSREIGNQDVTAGRRSVFNSPEVALEQAMNWLNFLHAVQNRGFHTHQDLYTFLEEQAPLRLATEQILRYRVSIVRAARSFHFPPAALAGLVDNELSGTDSAYGLAGKLRDFTDVIALRNAQLYGSSGVTGNLSKTVGIAQMSWEDSLLQEERFRAFKVSRFRFPQNEAQARTLLLKPDQNLLFTASRLRGYLNAALGFSSLDTQIVTNAEVYFLAGAWHNSPEKAQLGYTWGYAWNAFFKSCLYEFLFERVS